MNLTDRKIRNAKPTEKVYRLAGGKGLYLEVAPSGSLFWRYRYKIAGKENMYALGQFFRDGRAGHVSLDEARRLRAEVREIVKTGVHPAHQRSKQRAARVAANANTFEAVAKEWLAERATEWGGTRWKQEKRWLERDVYPHIGSMPIGDVTPAQILEIMRRVASGAGAGKVVAPTVARHLRQRISRIYGFAISTLRADVDPSAPLRDAIKAPKITHRRPLDQKRFPALFEAVRTYPGDSVTMIALQLLCLTFVRQGELRGAAWSEFDLDQAVWKIPAERMKMRTAHVVPLSRQAVELVRRLHAITGNRTHLFPNRRNPRTGMGKTTLNAALVRMGFEGELTPHGFRATASTLLNEAGFRADVVERQLAHEERDQVRASYNQAEYMRERADMMQAWADRVEALSAGDQKVIVGRFNKAA